MIGKAILPERRATQMPSRYDSAMTILGSIAGEPPEPMTREQFEAARQRLKATLNGVVTMDKRDLERLIAEVVWLKKRLRRVEAAVEPLVSEIRRFL
jgi:hypothetical protein